MLGGYKQQSKKQARGRSENIAWYDRSAELAVLYAAKEKVLLRGLVLRVHHDDAAQLRHCLHLQHTCVGSVRP